MKTTHLFAIAAAIGALSSTAVARAASWEQVDTLVHETTTSVEIELDETTVLCSSADYGALFLKILIPELATITLLDHQNFGAGAPCVAAGMCAEGNMPADLLTEEPTETVDIKVKAIRKELIDHDAQTCTVSLQENVDVIIRGKEFTHQRFASLGTRPYADCLLSPGTGTGTDTDTPLPSGDAPIEIPADEPGDYQPQGSAGGCSTGGESSHGLGLLLALGMVAGWRRRRR